MKLSNLFVAGMLVAAAMVVSAQVAKADGVIDPRIIINKGGDPTCGNAPGQLACLPADGTLPALVFGGVDQTTQFSYNCPASNPGCVLTDLFSVTADLTEVPVGAEIGCASDVFVACHLFQNNFHFEGDVLFFTLHVVFDDNGLATPSPCLNPSTQGATCSGFLRQGDEVIEFISTPEPSSLALLAVGLIGVLGFGRKRWMTASSI